MLTQVVLCDFRSSPATLATLEAVAHALVRQANEHAGLPAPKGWGCEIIMRATPQPTEVSPEEWVLGLFDRPDQPGALGYHDRTPHGLPLMKVFPALCEQDGVPWTACASHELLETLADPECCRVAQDVYGVGDFWALEICDAVEADRYDIDGVKVSNFVLPCYFEPPTAGSVKLDHMGLVRDPYEIRPGGYGQVWVSGEGWTQKQTGALRPYRVAIHGRSAARRG